MPKRKPSPTLFKMHWHTKKPLKRIRIASAQEMSKVRRQPFHRFRVGKGEVLAKGEIIPREKYPISFEEIIYIFGLPEKVGSKGFLNFNVLVSPDFGKYMDIRKIHVPCAPVDYRRKGLATDFLKEAERIAREQKCNVIVASISSQNKSVKDVFEKAGFTFEQHPLNRDLLIAKKRLHK